MAIKIKGNVLEERYAGSMHHPVTCANPAPWLIQKLKIVVVKKLKITPAQQVRKETKELFAE